MKSKNGNNSNNNNPASVTVHGGFGPVVENMPYVWEFVPLKDIFFFPPSCHPVPLLMLQSWGRRDPPWDLPALHPAAVLPGDVHNRDAQIHVPAGGAAAAQKKYRHTTYASHLAAKTVVWSVEPVFGAKYYW